MALSVKISCLLFFFQYIFKYMAGDGKGDKWFQEINPSFWPGQAFSLEIDEILHKQRSKYQDVLVFKRLSI